MVFVGFEDEPSSWSKFINGTINVVATVLAIFPPTMKIGLTVKAALAAAKRLNGQTLHGSDYADLALWGLQVTGKLTVPTTEEVATANGQKAYDAAKAAGDIDKVAEVARANEIARSLAGIGIWGLNGAQTISVIKAAGTGDPRQFVSAMMSGYGDGYVQTALGKLGVDPVTIANISPENIELIQNITESLVAGDDLDTALGLGGLQWLDDITGASEITKEFLKDMGEDFQSALTFANSMFDDEVLGPLVDMINEAAPNLDALFEQMKELQDDFDATVAFIEEEFAPILDTFDEAFVQPLVDFVDTGLSSFITSANQTFDQLPEGIQEQLSSMDEKFEQEMGEAYKKLPDALKEASKRYLVDVLLDADGTPESELAISQAFTKELVTLEAIAALDNPLVNALTAPVFVAGVHAAFDAAITGQGSVSGEFVNAITRTAAKRIQNSLERGTFGQDFTSYIDSINGKRTLASGYKQELDKNAEDAAVAAGNLAAARGEKQALENERNRLTLAANAEDASDLDRQNLIDFMGGTYLDDLRAVNDEITLYDGQVQGYIAEQDRLLPLYDESRTELSVSTLAFDAEVAKYTTNVTRDTAEAIAEELGKDINWDQYRTINNLGPDVDVFDHYLNEGLKNGLPINLEEYTARTDQGLSDLINDSMAVSDIPLWRMTEEERALAYTAINNNIIQSAEQSGLTVLQYIQQNKDSYANADHINLVVGQAFTPPGQATLTPDQINQSLNGRDVKNIVYSFYGLDVDKDDFTQEELATVISTLQQNNKKRVIMPDGSVEYQDPETYIKWNSDTQQFDTYESQDNNAFINSIVSVEGMEKDPAPYLNLLSSMSLDDAIMLENARRDAADLETIDNAMEAPPWLRFIEGQLSENAEDSEAKSVISFRNWIKLDSLVLTLLSAVSRLSFRIDTSSTSESIGFRDFIRSYNLDSASLMSFSLVSISNCN